MSGAALQDTHAAPAARATTPASRPGTTERAGHVLRALVIAGVLLLLLLAHRESAGERGVIEVHDAVVPAAARAALLVRTSPEPPGAHALDALAAMAVHAPLLASLPAAPRLVLVPPPRLIAGRAAALAFTAAGSAGTQARVDLRAAGGALLDSAFVQFDEQGRARGAFRVRAPREGWQEWRIVAGAVDAVTGAWSHAAQPPRVLVASGAPDAEARFLVRALEESGLSVELRQPFGQGLTAGAAPPALSSTVEELRGVDVVVVLHGARLDAARRAALVRFAEQGGGVLVAARDSLLHMLGLVAGAQPAAREVAADELRWQLPPELTALQGGTLRAVVEPLAPAARAVTVAYIAAGAGARTAAAAQSPAATLALHAVGSGRAAALGLRESWRWRVGAGAIDEHREFWRSLIDWLAPPPDPLLVEFAHPFSAVGLPARAELDAAAAPPLVLHRPDGATEPLAFQQSARDSGRARVAFSARDTGVHRLTRTDGRTVAAVRALPDVRHESAARLALLADASDGRTLDDAALRDTIAARDPSTGAFDWRVIAFVLVLSLSLTDWALRRLRGAP